MGLTARPVGSEAGFTPTWVPSNAIGKSQHWQRLKLNKPQGKAYQGAQHSGSLPSAPKSPLAAFWLGGWASTFPGPFESRCHAFSLVR